MFFLFFFGMIGRFSATDFFSQSKLKVGTVEFLVPVKLKGC